MQEQRQPLLQPRQCTAAFRSMVLGTALACAGPVTGDTPLGWIQGDFVNAYTQEAGTMELTAERIEVNDTIDFLDVRDDMIAGNRRLVDNSGDLEGWQGTLRVGILDSLSAFYLRQQHDLTLKLGEINRLNVVGLDQALQTTREELGLKWTFYQAGFSNPNRETTAASLELAWLKNESDDFNLAFDSINFSSDGFDGAINFAEPQTAGIQDLEDDGWRARLIYSRPLRDSLVGSAWLGYSQHDATSGTGSTVPIDFINEALTQDFDLEEKQWRLGISLNWQIRPRLPLQLSYEYIKIHDQTIQAIQGEQTDIISLPSFLSSTNLSRDDANHTLSGSLSWWFSPRAHVGLTGKLYSHQFLGVLPHYNNPLSASFSDTMYGYVGLRFGARLF